MILMLVAATEPCRWTDNCMFGLRCPLRWITVNARNITSNSYSPFFSLLLSSQAAGSPYDTILMAWYGSQSGIHFAYYARPYPAEIIILIIRRRVLCLFSRRQLLFLWVKSILLALLLFLSTITETHHILSRSSYPTAMSNPCYLSFF